MFIFDMQVHIQIIQVKFLCQGLRQDQGHRSKKHVISSRHPFCGTVSLQLQWRQVHFSQSGSCYLPAAWAAGGECWLEIADPQPAGRICGLQMSDLYTDRVMTERVGSVSCLQVVCLQLKGKTCITYSQVSVTSYYW